jgi:hypothetical protein
MLLQGNQGQTGKQTGQNLTASLGEYGEQLASELQPRYYENTYRGQKFSACNTAAVTIGALTATNVSFALYNPPGSGKNLAIVDASFGAGSTVFASGAVFFAVNPQTTTPAGTTALTIRNNLLTGNTGAASIAQAYSAATLSATPVAIRPFYGCVGPAASTVTPVSATTVPFVKDDVAGEIILTPGTVLSIQGSVAAVANGFVGISWDEISI